jgi:diguanylate cyclase (GGDEF)-like protein
MNLILQLTGALDFFISIRYVNLVLLASIIFGFYELIYETFKRKNLWAKRVLEYMSILLIMAAFETIMFFKNDFSFISHFTSIGILIFVVLMGKDSVKHFQHLSRESFEKAYFEKLAYEDVLTKGKNRLCYNRKVDEYLEEKKSFRLTILDINNLKTINDRYGHDKGDEAIVYLSKILKDSFSGQGTVYRLSGDEFSVLSSVLEEEDYITIKSKILESVKELNEKLEYSFSIAMGSGVFEGDGEKSFGDFYHEVDQLMYKNKGEQKIKIV